MINERDIEDSGPGKRKKKLFLILEINPDKKIEMDVKTLHHMVENKDIKSENEDKENEKSAQITEQINQEEKKGIIHNISTGFINVIKSVKKFFYS